MPAPPGPWDASGRRRKRPRRCSSKRSRPRSFRCGDSAEALGNLGAAAQAAAPALRKALDDPDSGVRAAAALALWKIGQDPKALPALTDLLRNGSDAAPYQAAVALGQLGAEPAAVAALIAALEHRDADDRRAAARSLGQIGAAAMPALEKAVAEGTAEGRRGAVEAIAWMGPPAVGPLIAVVRSKSPAACRAAARRWAAWARRPRVPSRRWSRPSTTRSRRSARPPPRRLSSIRKE